MPEDDTQRLASRRSIIKTIGVGVATAAVAGRSVADNDYDDTVDIVEAGADNSGSEPIDDVFHEHADDNTLIEFPDGEYAVNDLTLYGLTDFGMVGTGDAVLVPGNNADARTWIAGTNNRNIRVENFTIDNTEIGAGTTFSVHAYDGLVVRDITKLGHHDNSRAAFGFRILDKDGEGLVENLTASDGGQSVGIYTDPDGTITFRDCHIEEFENNGLYGSLGTGPVHVEGGFFRNNNVCSVRLSAPGSSVTGAVFRVDDPPSGFGNCRAIRIADGPGPVHIEDCEIHMTSGRGTGGIVGAFSGGSFHVRDSAIYVGPEFTTVGSGGKRTSYAIYVDPATQSKVGTRTIENTVIQGAGNYVAPVRFARDNNEIRNLCIEQSGHRRNGILFEDSDNNLVEDTSISVPGEQIALDNSTAERNNVSTDADCEWPSDIGNGADDDAGADLDGDTITITGNGSTAHYEFTVEGDVEKSTAYGGTINEFDEVSEVNEDHTVTGRTTNEPDSFTFNGYITEFKASEDVDVQINGEAVPQEVVGTNVLTVEGNGRTVNYEFTVDGPVQKSTAYGGTINDYDTVNDDGTVTGRTTNEPDSYSYVGIVRGFEANGPVEILVDGEKLSL